MVYRAGGVRAKIYHDDSVANVQIERSFKNSDGEYQATDTFRINDLPRVVLVAQKAYEFLALTEAEVLDG